VIGPADSPNFGNQAAIPENLTVQPSGALKMSILLIADPSSFAEAI
jgi:hypothetical protein